MTDMKLALKIAADVKAALDGINKINGQISTLGKQVKSTDSQANALGDTFKRVGAGVAGYFGVGQIKAFAFALRDAQLEAARLSNTLAFATGSQAAGAAAFKYVSELSNQLGVDLQSAAEGFAKFAAAARGTAIDAGQTRGIFEAVTKASAAMGLTAADTQGVFLSLSQMMSKGTVQAEELRGQLGERLPGAFGLAAKSMGVTTAELGKMLEQGKVISADFLPKFARELERAFGNTSAAVAVQNVNRLNNAWLQFKQSLGTGLDASGITAPKWLAINLREATAAFEDGTKKGHEYIGMVAALYSLVPGTQKGYFSKEAREARQNEITKEIDFLEAQQKRLNKTGGSLSEGNTVLDKTRRVEQIKALRKEYSSLASMGEINLPGKDVLREEAARQKEAARKALEEKRAAAGAVSKATLADIEKRSKAEAAVDFALRAAEFDAEALDEERRRQKLIDDHEWELQELRHFEDTKNLTMEEYQARREALTRGEDVTQAMATAQERLASIRQRLDAEVTIGAKSQTAAQIELRQETGKLGAELAGSLIPRLQILIATAPDDATREKWRALYAEIGGMQATGKEVGPWAGMKKGLDEYSTAVTDTFSTMKQAVNGAFKGMEDALVQFVMKGEVDFGRMADSIISDLIRIQVQQSITQPLAGMMGSVNWASMFTASANGNVFQSAGLHAYANQIVSRPTMFAFAKGAGLMGEAGPEAIMPLKRDASGRLGVSGGGGNMTVNVIEAPGRGGQRSQRSDGNGGQVLDIFVEQIKSAIAGDIARGSGDIPAALSGTYGLNRAPGGY